MIISNPTKLKRKAKYKLNKTQFKKMIPLSEPIHVGMNVFPHLFIQFVDIKGEKVKILWDFSIAESNAKYPNKKSYPRNLENIVSVNPIPKRKTSVTFIEYQKNGTVIVIQL